MSTEVQQQTNLERAPGEPTGIREAWHDFKEQVGAKPPERKTSPSKEQLKQTEPKDVLTPEQRETFNKTGELPKGEKSEAKPAAEPEGDGQQPTKNEGGKQEQKPQLTTEQAFYDRMYQRAAKEPDFDKFVEHMHEPLFPNSREGWARMQTAAYALRQIPNSEDVVYFLGRPENRSVIRNMQDAPPHKIAAVLHSISADLRFGSRTPKETEQPKPKVQPAPKEVGGRGAPMGDRLAQAAKEGDFGAFDKEMSARARRNQI